ncbi:MAG TPA: M1 family aminopeptidase, partial [Vicinamibacterales bacterium]|nr:M1 family aminopeptidase [Vicinamibacterales bacterium]
FITAGTASLLNGAPLDELRVPEMTIVHEFGHQYWYGMVASNEFEEAWLDEGINSYSSGRVMAHEYGAAESLGRIARTGIAELDMLRIVNAVLPSSGIIRQPAWEHRDDLSYGFNSYFKPQIVLMTLERILGGQTMARAMRSYFERWRFRHPHSDDFYAAIEESAGQDLSRFFEQLVESPDTLDYEVDDVRIESSDGRYRSTVRLRRHGGVVLPADLEIKFEGAPPERTTWNAEDEQTTLTFDRATRIEWARLDPEQKLLVDKHWLNNGRRARADSRVAASLTSRWMFWLQHAHAFLGL